tara:strand:- start:32 stop:409 length:378 start_codon:yes stop_codon:yes gene_type:complete
VKDDDYGEFGTGGTDVSVPTKDVAELPIISGEAYQHIGRFSGALVLSCFEQIGGLPRMASWADQNPTDFYTKLFPKMISKTAQVDHTGSITLDDAISRLEGSSEAVEANFTEVPEQFEEPQEYDL